LNNYKRYLIALSAYQSGGGHIPSCYSCIDLISSIYSEYIIKSNKYEFVLSKGHAALALYATLAFHSIISEEELLKVNSICSNLGGHPDASKVKNVLFNTGSLGHGFPVSLGYAIGSSSRKHIFCMLGDGECNEGTTWESAILGVELNVQNLTVIVDYNKSTNNILAFNDLPKTWESIGWEVIQINGHNQEEISQALKKSTSNQKGRPKVIIANTVKGFGVPFMENNGLWHYRAPNDNELNKIKDILQIK
tara:strand:+ start:31265 stop:32014 length:750 start_codon:yes stop_codon:yes gene_type:complete